MEIEYIPSPFPIDENPPQEIQPPKTEEYKTEKNSIKSIFQTSLFEEKEISDFICPLCKNIPNPHQCYEITCCGALFCISCITNWLKENNNTCPLCKKEIESKEKNLRKIDQKSKMIYRMMLKLNLKCPYDCGWKGSFAEIYNHFKNCPLKEFECKYNKIGCNFTGKKNECDEHEKNNVKLHLQIALDFIEKNPVITRKKKIQFDENNTCKVSCHEHVLTYMSSDPWICNGNDLDGGCCSSDCHFETPYRFRCQTCNFNLCNMCCLKYAID